MVVLVGFRVELVGFRSPFSELFNDDFGFGMTVIVPSESVVE